MDSILWLDRLNPMAVNFILYWGSNFKDITGPTHLEGILVGNYYLVLYLMCIIIKYYVTNFKF